jgi:hypothetical protein
MSVGIVVGGSDGATVGQVPRHPTGKTEDAEEGDNCPPLLPSCCYLLMSLPMVGVLLVIEPWHLASILHAEKLELPKGARRCERMVEGGSADVRVLCVRLRLFAWGSLRRLFRISSNPCTGVGR